MSVPLAKESTGGPVGRQKDLDRMKQAAERYRKAMTSEKDRERLIEDYLPLVKSIVSRMRHHFPDSYEMEDMYGIGAKALVVAVNQFDPSKGKAFGNYAALRIRGALLDELRRIDSLPRANRAKARSLQATIAELEARDKRPPSMEEIRNELSLSPGLRYRHPFSGDHGRARRRDSRLSTFRQAGVHRDERSPFGRQLGRPVRKGPRPCDFRPLRHQGGIQRGGFPLFLLQ